MIILFITLLIILLFIGMPIGFALLAVGSLGIISLEGFGMLQGILSTAPYRSVNSFTFSTIPLFIVMAHFISKSGIADDLFNSILKWVGHIPGGTGVATIFSSAGFGALSGSSVAATSVMSEIAVPKMIKANYPESLAAGLVATTTGTLAVLIPPSIPLILYGIHTENSIGKLLIAGILPGLLLVFLLSITAVFIGIRWNSKTEKHSWKARWLSLRKIWPAVLLVLSLLFTIYFGITTPTEAASFGAFGALVIGLALKKLNTKLIIESLLTTVRQTTMVFMIIVGAHIFAYYITLTRIGDTILNAIVASGLPSWAVFLFIILIYLIVGMFLEIIASMLLTLPLIYPLIIELGYDPIWFGVILVIVLEIGLVTPPVGLSLFVTSQHSGVPVDKVLIGSIPFIIILFITIIILVLFPQIVLFLPSIM